MEKYKCCICGKEFTDWGNDPWPVNTDENAKCCDDCDMSVVVPARLNMMYKKGNQNESK